MFLDVTDCSLIKVYWNSLRQWCISTKLHDVTFQKIIFIFTAMRIWNLKCIRCVCVCFFFLTTCKDMYLFTMLVNYISSDVLSVVSTSFLFLIQHLILVHFMESQISSQYFMSDLAFSFHFSFFSFLSGSYKPLLQCLIWKFVI